MRFQELLREQQATENKGESGALSPRNPKLDEARLKESLKKSYMEFTL